MNLLRLSLLVPLLAVMMTGCEKTVTYTLATAPEYMVTRDYTPFYRLGPGQVQGPDANLKARTYVKLLRHEMGYSYIQLDDGTNGYVPNDNIMIAPPHPKPAVDASAPVGAYAYPVPKKHFHGSGGQVNDTPLPELSMPAAQLDIAPEVMPSATPTPAPTPAETPKFRY